MCGVVPLYQDVDFFVCLYYNKLQDIEVEK